MDTEALGACLDQLKGHSHVGTHWKCAKETGPKLSKPPSPRLGMKNEVSGGYCRGTRIQNY